MATVISKSTFITNPTNNTINRAQFALCVVTNGGETLTVKDVNGNTLGEVYFHASGDTVILEKAPGDTITLAAGKVMAVGSPRS
jgi:hypothetical protein